MDQCLQTVHHLASAGVEIEVMTTCALDLHHEWHIDCHRKGTRIEEGLLVHRFPIEKIDFSDLFELNRRLLSDQTLCHEEEKRFLAMHVNSLPLLRTLAKTAKTYDKVCFIPYLFGTTYYGALLCPGNAVLIPCLHDEPYARMSVMPRLFDCVNKVVFHTGAEQRLADSLYGDLSDKGILMGEGVDTSLSAAGERFRDKYNIRTPFILYAGRKSPTKNVDTLVRYFSTLRSSDYHDLKLVLIGPGSVPIPNKMKNEIIDLGFISEQDKKDACTAADILCQPSLNESFSLIIMEAWLCGTPCLVHGGCEVTREHVTESGGGLYFENYGEFRGTVQYLMDHPDIRRRMGESGKTYVKRRYTWDIIVRRWIQEILET